MLNKAIENIQDLSKTWAAAGLKLGQYALETTSKSLEATAQYLNGLTTKLQPTPPEATEAATEPPAESTEAKA